MIQLMQKGPSRDVAGRVMVTATNESNPWWLLFEQAIIFAGGKLSKPEILSSTTDSRFVRQLGIPALGFSPMINTPILLHDNNEVTDPGLISNFLVLNAMPLSVTLTLQFLEDKVFLNGIKVYEHVIRALTSFKG
jgi:aminoacylase